MKIRKMDYKVGKRLWMVEHGLLTLVEVAPCDYTTTNTVYVQEVGSSHAPWFVLYKLLFESKAKAAKLAYEQSKRRLDDIHNKLETLNREERDMRDHLAYLENIIKETT